LSRILLVAAGYLVAFVVATAVVSIYVAVTDGPDRQGSDGMYAFGDSILFLAVFSLAAIPATSAALFFLRPHHLFWRVVSVAALCIAATGIAALISYLAYRSADTSSLLGAWSVFSPLRILLAPLFAIAFFLSALFAPIRACRMALLGATVVEAVVFVWVALIWFHQF
jgi:hypothetical protein